MAEGEKMELRLHYKRANEQQLLQTEKSCQLAGQGNLQRRAPGQNFIQPEASQDITLHIIYFSNKLKC